MSLLVCIEVVIILHVIFHAHLLSDEKHFIVSHVKRTIKSERESSQPPTWLHQEVTNQIIYILYIIIDQRLRITQVSANNSFIYI